MRLVFRPQVQGELEEARDWYDGRENGLGSEFLAEFDTAIERIKQNPAVAQKVFKDARRLVLTRFPYLVIYAATKDEIVIYACVHGKRDPRRWKARI